MPLIALVIALQSKIDKQVYIVVKEYEMSNAPAAQKNSYKISTIFIARESVKGLDKNTRHIVDLDGSQCFILRQSDPIVGYVFADKMYSARIAFSLIEKALHSFITQIQDEWKTIDKDCNITIPSIRKLFELYQNPAKIDKTLLAIDKVNETKAILHQNIRKLLERGQSLEQLVEKSKDLPEAAKKYYKTTQIIGGGCCLIF